ncbi:lipopolysaccharide biosynthesis protein [Palleniella muris]|uniref:Lipopolysaccharide biosynthesis protein n=1 Tax=Palleniella muris TaxID=3038145 RepID=A0AC61QU16_9BACT|nr:lipopolysaccharide biosynthesis protein [Palleniella muris]TGX84129.1 lipopolysaccharide biosynthesis protein [Palleniella muris]
MSKLASLAKDTAIYGLSSIVGRFLNYLLVPLYTHVIAASSGGYGVVTNLYAYTALILVILTFGMETTFFRFANKDGENPDTVFSTTMGIVGALTAVFLLGVFGFATPLCEWLGYADHHAYVLLMAATVALDAVQAIPFSFLRYKKKALKFAALKLLFIIMNIGLNLLYFVVLGKDDVYYVFSLNLVCTALITFFFIPELLAIKWRFDFSLLRRMLSYSWPILVLGIAGILNQAFDKMIFPWAYTRTSIHTMAEAQVELGVYGACVKVAMIMAMITQAFRYAYEPIVFAKAKDKDSKEYYAVAMKYFLIFTLFAFLCVMGYLNILKHIVRSDYHAGLQTIPIVMAAEIMMGIYFNLSFWYKLIDKTIWGAWFSFAGCAVLVAVNILFVPEYGYMACAWGGFAGYGTAMVLSYIVGQRKNPIAYPMGSITVYILITILFYLAIEWSNSNLPTVGALAVNTSVIFLFVAHVVHYDLPLGPILKRLHLKK